MNANEIYITLEGDIKVILNDRVISWSDRYGSHTGKVIAYGRTSEQGGNEVTRALDVFKIDCGADGIRELRRHEMRDVIANNH